MVTPVLGRDLMKTDMAVEGDRVGVGGGNTEMQAPCPTLGGEIRPSRDHPPPPSTFLGRWQEIDVQVSRVVIDEIRDLHFVMKDIQNPAIKGLRSRAQALKAVPDFRPPGPVEPGRKVPGVKRAEDVAARPRIVLEDQTGCRIKDRVGRREGRADQFRVAAPIGAVAPAVTGLQTDPVERRKVAGQERSQDNW